MAVTAAALLLRDQMAGLLSVEQEWAAAATLPTGCLWLLLSIERGVLQGVHAYREVGWSIVLEATGRLAFGLAARRRRASASPAPTSARRSRWARWRSG